MTLRVAGGPVRGRRIRGGVSDPVIQAGGLYLLDDRTRYVRPGLPFARAQPVYGVQADGQQEIYTGPQVPWEDKGVRLDPSWVQSFFHTHSLSNAAWGITGLQTPTKTAIGPNGPDTAWVLTETTAAATGTGGGQGCAVVSGQSYTIKAEVSNRTSNRFFGVVFTASGFGGNLAANINPVDGTVTVNSGSITAGSRPLANGNWEFWATATATATATVGILFRLSTGQTTYFPNYTGDGLSGVNVHALNFTNTAYPVPTTSATVLAVTVPSFTFGGLFADLGITLGGEIGLGIECISAVSAFDKVVCGMSSGAFGNSIYFIPRNFSGQQSCSMISGGAAQLEGMSVAAAAVGAKQRVLLRAKVNDSRAGFNGALAPVDGACVLPVGLTNITVGKAPWGGNANDFAGWVSKLFLFPLRGPADAELQALTTL